MSQPSKVKGVPRSNRAGRASAVRQTSPASRRRFLIKLILSLIAILIILYFVSEDLFYNATSAIIIIGVPLLSIFIIISPFLYIKKKFGKLTIGKFFAGLPISIGLAILVGFLLYQLLLLAIGAVSNAFLSTF